MQHPSYVHPRNDPTKRPKRRSFSATHKRQIVQRALNLREHCLTWGDIAHAVGVNQNLLLRWVKAASDGTLGNSEYSKRRDKIERMHVENLRLRSNAIMARIALG
jgi:transposase-like protein